MTAGLALWVLFGALLHASWNTLIKGGQDKLMDTLLVALGSMLIGMLCLPFLPLPAPAAWPYLLGSVLVHVAYFYLIIHAYKVGDLSVVYPLMRGGAPLLTAIIAVCWLGESVTTGSLGGIGLLCSGILLLAGNHWHSGADRRAIGFGLTNAVVVVSYTLFDGLGARQSGHALSYTMWLFALNALPLLLWACWKRGGDSVVAGIRQGYRRMMIGGACSVGAYGITLWAMTQAPIALVATLRETAVLFAALFGALLLRERLGLWRILAALAVCSGAMLIKLG
ncbi:DMT family transporter [Chitinivorax sp. B]|uniref:DMT family transporter n=1 Tax=Chitinivorax sp. B TaxID=2502235 RepID=UPI0010F66F46|nr:DMT family transporter [Chitinivorax sp. B]